MTTMHDVAKRAGVSIATVSHVINGTRPVAESTEALVSKAMADLRYRPNALARSLRRRVSQTIGMIVPDSANPFFAEVAHSIEEYSFAADHTVILCNTEGSLDREQTYADVLTENMVAGIVFVAAGPSVELVCELKKRRIAVVVVDREVPGVEVDAVRTDHLGGGKLATQHLVDLGHERIACIAGGSDVTPTAQRLTGYLEALGTSGIPVDERLIRSGDYRFEGGYEACRELLDLDDPPTAIFACNDLMAVGSMRAAFERGYRVPEDLSIVGYDDVQLASYTNPPLTTVCQPTREIAAKAVDLLLVRIQDRDTDPSLVTIDVGLVERQSTAPISRGVQ